MVVQRFIPFAFIGAFFSMGGSSKAQMGPAPDTPSATTENSEQSSDITDEFELLEAEKVVESASRHQQEIGMSPSAIFVLTRQDIEASGAANVIDLLRLVPGLDVKFNTRSYPSVTSRIAWSDEGARVLVLVDGREANYEVLGNVVWELQPFVMEDIERIEVIRGPVSSLYGANAMAGVINIVTRAIPERTSLWGSLQAGEVGYGAAGLRAATRLGDFGFSLGANAQEILRPTLREDWGMRSLKLRSVAEYRVSNSQRLTLDGGLSLVDGVLGNTLGVLQVRNSLKTLRLSYAAPSWQAQLYWAQVPVSVLTPIPMAYGNITFAEVKPIEADAHVIDSQVQWQAPTFWNPLLIIVGAGARLSLVKSDGLLDGDTFSDPTSDRYRQPGITHLEGRGGAFVHSEWTPLSWLAVTAGARFDYNSVTKGFLSPKLALVFRPIEGQFLRLGVTRAFRKPSFIETHMHGGVRFPKSSPIQGTAQDSFQEFMSGVLGNKDLQNEELDAYEVGYWGELFDKRLALSLDLYYYRYSNLSYVNTNIVFKNGFPDITQSTAKFENAPVDTRFYGLEFCARYSPNRNLTLLFAWSHREADSQWQQEPREAYRSPKNYLSLGGRFRLDSGFVGSLYAFARSSFYDPIPHNAGGLFSAYVPEFKPVQVLIFAKLGWRWLHLSGFELETGVKISQPIAPFSEPHWSYPEKAGAIDRDGQNTSGEELTRMVIGYLQGSF